ncbi:MULTISPECIES: hypothetical protein [Empedobacter]|uniref:hypothetical protein n=1 Tax=Empedobacter TaxID=59734 RepID=UPI002575A308|nr:MULTISPECIES: hypothetical protein [Empedobacter]MDM1042743.1 hypothetical protein [Empedobacter brevis]MDM1136673.1 hypothetical protein [Empedobacter sp. R750]
MKKIIYIITLGTIANFSNAQVSFGGKETVEGTATLVDFNNTPGNFRGIILSAVENNSKALASTASENNGTFLYDNSDSKVKMYENGTWVNLSPAGDNTAIIVNTSADKSSENQGVIIGKSTSNAKGILVLESADKAIILPRIANPDTTVKSPYPGMICYDTISKSLAVFNGIVWNYWK